jgi:hypothetical protein
MTLDEKRTAETGSRGMDCPPEWCRLNCFSERRIRVSGTGPVVTQPSPNRIGITVANNAHWQKSRVRG